MKMNPLLLCSVVVWMVTEYSLVSGQAAVCNLFPCVNGNCVVNAAGVPSCQCYPGYAPIATIPQYCVDIDECAATTGNPCAPFKCCNEAGRFRCTQNRDCRFRKSSSLNTINPLLLLLGRGGK